MDRFLSGDLEPVRGYYDTQLREGDTQSNAMFLNGLAEVELLQGDLEDARRHFVQAGRIMGNWATSGSEVFGAVVGDEGSKGWKGDPHEKVMNAFYTGIVYWFRGEPDNARAAFKNGILADAESDEGDAQVDSSLLYWLAGRASIAMGVGDQADDFFEEARQARAFATGNGAFGASDNPVLRDPRSGNLVCLVSLGIGPTKFASGPHGSIAVMRANPGGAESAEIFVDGKSLGRTHLLLDVDYQATTRGGKTIEGIRKGKAIFKDASIAAGAILIDRGLNNEGSNPDEQLAVGLGLLALGWLTSARADVRHWATLPRHVHVLTAEVEPGEWPLEIVFYDAYGRELPALAQSWTVDVPESGEGIYHFRSLPGLDRPIERSS